MFGTFQPLTKQELKNAINAHLSGSSEKGPINDWDTSLITDMSWLFCATDYWSECNCGDYCGSYKNFNEDLSNWDTSKVTTMSGMFR